MSLFNELKRRNVIRVAIAYAVVAWLLLQVADIVLNNVAAPAWVFHTIVLVLGIGFVLVVGFSWAFELTPEGLKREHEVDRSQSIAHHTGRKLDLITIAVLVVALGYFALDRFVLSGPGEAAGVAAPSEAAAPAEPADTAPDRSIAVLPFADLSPDKDQEFFSDGLSEELLNLLAKVPELRVAARTSAFYYKGKDIRIDQVGKELGVAHVLEGSVRTSGERIRVTAQLIKVDDGFHLWSETYDRTLDDVFAIQDEIAGAVVDALKVTMLGETPHVAETAPEAYALYLQARHLENQRSEESLLRAEQLYREALDITPDYPAAWTGLAQTYVQMSGAGVLVAAEAYRRASHAANRALAIDPNHAPAYAVLGEIAIFTNEPAESANHLRRALAMDPANPDIIREAAALVELLGRPEEAIRLLDYVVARDPVNADAHAGLGRSCRVAGHWERAIEAYRTSLALAPARVGSWQGIGESLLFLGRYDEALEAYAKEPDEEWAFKGKLLVQFQQGLGDEFEAGLAEFIERWGGTWPSEVAHVYAFTGQADAAFAWLDRAVTQNEEGLYQQYYQPLLRSLHDDPRWMEFRARIIGTAEDLASIPFEVNLPD